jgi:hypothetical protein
MILSADPCFLVVAGDLGTADAATSAVLLL